MVNMILGYIKCDCQIEVGNYYSCSKTSTTVRHLVLNSDLPEEHGNHRDIKKRKEALDQRPENKYKDVSLKELNLI